MRKERGIRPGLLGPGILLLILGVPQLIGGAVLVAENPSRSSGCSGGFCLGSSSSWGFERGAGILLLVTGGLHVLPGAVLTGLGARPTTRVTVKTSGTWVGVEAQL